LEGAKVLYGRGAEDRFARKVGRGGARGKAVDQAALAAGRAWLSLLGERM